jgi:hypothetical protein
LPDQISALKVGQDFVRHAGVNVIPLAHAARFLTRCAMARLDRKMKSVKTGNRKKSGSGSHRLDKIQSSYFLDKFVSTRKSTASR